MFEIPESTTIARQLNEAVKGKTIKRVVVNASPHKFAFYCGNPNDYGSLLGGQVIGGTSGLGAMIEMEAGDRRIVLGDGANLRYYAAADKAPQKHQTLIELDDGSALVCTIQMYGTILAFVKGSYENKYYQIAKQKPSPLTHAFDEAYFFGLKTQEHGKLSAKAFLATEQRIPGLGNGVLQDILFYAGIHPKRKMATVSQSEYQGLYRSIRQTLLKMTELCGRDTEKDLFGNPGQYATVCSKNTEGKPCPVCGEKIQKMAYLGGAIYWCPHCQPY